jgi:cell division protein FtsB
MPRVRSEPVPGSAHPRNEKTDVPLKRKALSLAIFLIAAASMLNALFGDRGLLELLRARQEIQSLDREIVALREMNQTLLEEIRDLKSSPLAVERLARENIGLVKPGELVLLIQEPADVNNALPEPIGDADPSTQATSQEPLATTP